MLQFLLDTEHFTLLEHGHPSVATRVASAPAGTVGISIVTAEESLRGRLSQVARARTGAERVDRYRYFGNSLQLILTFSIAAFDDKAEAAFDSLRRTGLKCGFQDLKIAAIALALPCTIITRNKRDFSGISGLQVDDWSV